MRGSQKPEDLDLVERRGNLIYSIGEKTISCEGHFMLSLDRRNVTARKIGGRNRWSLCSADAVIAFFPNQNIG
jgi:hypothetical protein